MAVEYAPPTPRPAMRGAMHRAAVPVAVVLTIVLTVRAESGGELVAVLVYGVCVTAMLTVSGIYHSARPRSSRASPAATARSRDDPRRHRRHAKKKYIDEVVRLDLHAITKLRSDTDCLFLYTGPHPKRRGARRKYDGKVNFQTLNRFEDLGTMADERL